MPPISRRPLLVDFPIPPSLPPQHPMEPTVTYSMLLDPVATSGSEPVSMAYGGREADYSLDAEDINMQQESQSIGKHMYP
eukprot:gene2536-13382_t